MKKILLVAALFVVTLSVSAQTEKGKWLLGGQAWLNSDKANEDADAVTTFTIAPYVGYFINNNFALGLGVGYQDAATEAFIAQPFGRYYMPVSDNFKFFGQLSIPLEFGTGDDDYTQYGVAVAPGFAFFPAKKVALEVALSGISFDQVADGGRTNFSIGTDFFSPRLGVVFHLGGK